MLDFIQEMGSFASLFEFDLPGSKMKGLHDPSLLEHPEPPELPFNLQTALLE